MKVHTLSLGLLGSAILASCSGTGLNFEREFEQVQHGATMTQVRQLAGIAPLLTESFELAGFALTRMEIADVKARYAFTFAATPLTDPRLVFKSITPHAKCN